eukprot:1394543-Amphidinium_carterae.1
MYNGIGLQTAKGASAVPPHERMLLRRVLNPRFWHQWLRPEKPCECPSLAAGLEGCQQAVQGYLVDAAAMTQNVVEKP